MRGRRAIAVALAAGAAAIGVGCGEDETASSEPEAPAETRVVVESQGGAFDPQAVYEAVAPGVVTVRSAFSGDEDATSLLDPDALQQGQGSGFVVSGRGEIVTNAHVVTNGEAGGGGELEPADEIYVQFADRNQVAAEVVGVDPFADVALLRVETDGLDLQPLDLGAAEVADVGDPVAAIGSPFGQEQSLSIGVVSATDRSIQSLTRFTIDGAIQTDASINPGNSGGPLLDAEGRVIGINQQIRTGSGTNEGVGFAVPIELAERSIEQLRSDGEPSYAFMGVTSQPLYPQLADRLNLDVDVGALIVEVTEGSPAEEAGLRPGDDELRFQGIEIPVGGDVIVAIDGEKIVDESDLPRRVALLEPGQEVTLEIIRDGEHEEVELTLGERPSSLGP
ncbi:MAG TPA: trypsin-like peptidase domain-containing protein [Solirubrobacterales bacterium]|nr:trypsin-like peptidase domain-containing protein [Solirubrobacterales bacterium]